MTTLRWLRETYRESRTVVNDLQLIKNPKLNIILVKTISILLTIIIVIMMLILALIISYLFWGTVELIRDLFFK
ncbi:MAG: hypothetical protein WCT77_11030 [Bacteroidota bacterium]